MSKRTIDQWTWDYWLVQRFVNLCYRFSYKRVCVHNAKAIPKNQPVILAPNHQNALMDALAFVYGTKHQNVFLARADIFKGKMVRHILHFLNIMPIYRIRDGYDSVKKNDEVFEKCISVLRNKHNPLCLFAEGNHGDKRRLRSMVKGMFRIAFMAQEDYGEKSGVKILPVGIDYGHYSNFQSTILLNFGEPIEVSDYFKEYQKDKAQAFIQLKEKLAIELSKYMIDIQTEEYYETYLTLRKIYNKSMRQKMGIQRKTLYDKFLADKKMIELLNKKLDEDENEIKKLDNLVKDYCNSLQKLKIKEWLVAKGKISLFGTFFQYLLTILTFPLFVLGLINNFIPYIIPTRFVSKIKDPQFHSTVKFVFGIILFPLYYIVLSIISIFVIDNTIINILYIATLPLTGLFAFYYCIWHKKLRGRLRFSFGKYKKERPIQAIMRKRKNIMNMMDKLITGTN